MTRAGEVNVFGMKVVAQNGRLLDVVCELCHEVGSVPAGEFNSTRCGSARCASTQGRNE
jgi:hypothetical protein